MQFHMLAYGDATFDGSAGDVQLPAIAEQIFSRSNNNFQVPTPLNLLFAYIGGIGLTRARINTGSLRSKGFPQIYPFNLTDVPPSPVKLQDLTNFPTMLRQEEDLRVDATNAAAASTVAILGVTPEPLNRNINARDLRWLRFTASVTAIDTGWSNAGSVAFQDTLEGGRYGIYGMGVQGANIVAARLILQNSFYRPGCLGQALNTNLPSDLFGGKLGKWGEFNTYSNPQIETLENAAGASSITGWLLCGKEM